ncbi:hypothetical protein Drorol1_Dr00023637 [Drosera rotundifolia]
MVDGVSSCNHLCVDFKRLYVSPHLFELSVPRTRLRLEPKCKPRILSKAKLVTIAALSDPFVLEIAETLEDSVSSFSSSSSPTPLPLKKLRDLSSESLLARSWSSRKDEPFRFTDISFIKSSHIQPNASPPQESAFWNTFLDTKIPGLVIADGYIVNALSDLSALPDGVFVGSLLNLSSDVIMRKILEVVSNFNGDLFSLLNGVGAPDLILVYVPEGCRLDSSLYLRHHPSNVMETESNNLPMSNPRVLVFVEQGGEIGIVEEYSSGDNTTHIKWTSVSQESGSSYKLVEVSCGGKLSRHNLHVQQVGPDTSTELSTLHLSMADQTQDLHSRVVLDHPRGYSRQLHKCIVAHLQGQAVFDGNVRVNRFAQQTDAGQLTRTLLLAPRATVNLKPNLQIIADDVKCSHGAAISDLEEDQLFYFLARGIDTETARRSLIFSFGAEVIESIPDVSLREKTKGGIRELLNLGLATPSSQC